MKYLKDKVSIVDKSGNRHVFNPDDIYTMSEEETYHTTIDANGNKTKSMVKSTRVKLCNIPTADDWLYEDHLSIYLSIEEIETAIQNFYTSQKIEKSIDSLSDDK